MGCRGGGGTLPPNRDTNGRLPIDPGDGWENPIEEPRASVRMMFHPVLQKGAVMARPLARQEDGHPEDRQKDERPIAGWEKFIYGTKAVIAILAVITLAGIALLILIWVSNPKHDTLEYEAGKACMQVLGVVLVGFVVSIATFTLQRNREDYQRQIEETRDDRQRKDELLNSTFSETLSAYHAVKRARRILRARIWAQEHGNQVDADVYDQQMALINDVKLKFEQLESNASLIQDARVNEEKLRECFEAVQEQLGELVTEWESARRRAAYIQGGISIADMPRMNKFLDPKYAGPFKAGIAGPIDSILSDLRGALLEPLKLPTPAVTG
jgi:hypothetical protein